MRKLTKSFQKRQSIASRVLCFLLVLAMVVTMVPALGGGNSTVQAAEGEKVIVVAQADGNVSQDSVDRANELLNAMPEKVLEGFCDNGWKFYVTDKNLANTFYAGIYNSVKGVTDFDNHEIFIEQRDAAVETAVVHEFGHYLDCINGYQSKTAEFADIFSSESNSFVQTFNVDFHYDVGEFFADGVYRYYDGEQKTLAQTCPRLAAFIENIVSES